MPLRLTRRYLRSYDSFSNITTMTSQQTKFTTMQNITLEPKGIVTEVNGEIDYDKSQWKPFVTHSSCNLICPHDQPQTAPRQSLVNGLTTVRSKEFGEMVVRIREFIKNAAANSER